MKKGLAYWPARCHIGALHHAIPATVAELERRGLVTRVRNQTPLKQANGR
jgi:hypothetical protein